MPLDETHVYEIQAVGALRDGTCHIFLTRRRYRVMTEAPRDKPFPRLRVGAWILCAGSFLWLYYSRHDSLENGMQRAATVSAFVAYGLYLFLGSIRGLTLVPSAGLMLLAIPFFPPM